MTTLVFSTAARSLARLRRLRPQGVRENQSRLSLQLLLLDSLSSQPCFQPQSFENGLSPSFNFISGSAVGRRATSVEERIKTVPQRRGALRACGYRSPRRRPSRRCCSSCLRAGKKCRFNNGMLEIRREVGTSSVLNFSNILEIYEISDMTDLIQGLTS
jgi:hypothetical protein